MITGDVYTFSADGTWTDEGHLQATDGTDPTVDRYHGTWTVDAPSAQVRFLYYGSHGEQITSSKQVRNGGRTLSNASAQGDWIYQKQ